MITKSNEKKAFGDFQTPFPLCQLTCQKLKQLLPNFTPDVIIEPTCGLGNFLLAAGQAFPQSALFGIEIDETKAAAASVAIPHAEIECRDYFRFDWDSFLKPQPKEQQYLLVGNPPWVTNSALSLFSIQNLPKKSNYKKLSGIDAITGCANFDICEYIIFDLLVRFHNCKATFAFLCKPTVAVKIYQEMKKYPPLYRKTCIFLFDSKQYFDIASEACLFLIMPDGEAQLSPCSVGRLDANDDTQWSQMGYVDGRFYGNLQDNRNFPDGESCFEWRQGIKHDCSQVMELICKGADLFVNKSGEEVQLEDEMVYPLFKSSHLKKPLMTASGYHVIVPQKHVGQDTVFLERKYPLTWKYLSSHRTLFENRKSTIYKNGIPFSVFGIGDYSFSKYKVAISGFYHNPFFVLSDTERPAMFDDTCYFLSFNDYSTAYTCMLILNSDLIRSFLTSLVAFAGKRPFTKKILQRIDFSLCSKYLSFSDLQETERKLSLPARLTSNDYMNFFSQVTSPSLF